MGHLRLAMLARDEAKRLPVIAEQLGDRIQSVVILLDDRTIDDTAEVAEQLWGHLDGRVVPFTFEHFKQARDQLLAEARPGADHLLLLDPDSPIMGEWPAELTDPAYECEWRYGGTVWHRVIILRTDVEAEYEGIVHEVIDLRGSVTRLSSCYVEARVTAGVERLEWIEGMLRRDAAINPRSAFYLGQTLRDLRRFDEAFGWYMRRAAMGHGWVEETCLAVYEAASILNVYDYELAANLWRRCIQLCRRAEPHYMLACQANERGLHSEALAWASQGLQLGPSQCELFVNRWIEQEGLSEQFAKAMLALTPTVRIDRAPDPVLQTEEQHG